jgi:CO dehydrogenase/acetyl-CoA synthase alpha subunit
MPTFALSKLDGLDELPHIRFPIFKLETNGHCEYDEWRKTIKAEGTYAAELKTLDTLMLLHAQMQRLAPAKYKELSGGGDIKDFEFRSRNLRIYLFKLPGSPGQEGKVVVIGGHNDKKQQKQDIARMRRLKKEFYDSLSK